jgi:ferrochelatase
MLEVAQHYHHFGGRSPINEQNRQLIAVVERDFAESGLSLPVYLGNRNWHPLLPDTLRKMAADGVRRALAFVTSPFSSYSSCRQYREDIARAQQEVGGSAPHVDKLRVFFNHPGFIEPMVERALDAWQRIPLQRRDNALLIFTAHSIPRAMAQASQYEEQLLESCRLVVEGVIHSLPMGDSTDAMKNWRLVYQSRSGSPQQPWLEPDVGEFVEQMHARSALKDVIVVPIGFISDHMEVLYDLDIELAQRCQRLGINMVRAATVGTHPRFVRMIGELILERISHAPQKLSLGRLGPSHDVCPDDCCQYPPTR